MEVIAKLKPGITFRTTLYTYVTDDRQITDGRL